MNYFRYVVLVWLIVIITGCTKSVGVPTPNAQKGEVYFFPKIELVSKVYFVRGTSSSEEQQFRSMIEKKIKQKGYFLEVTADKQAYKMVVEYNIFKNTTLLDEIILIFVDPRIWLFGSYCQLNANLKVSVYHHDKLIESYHYRKDFGAPIEKILPKATKYFNTMLEQLWDDMAKRSKLTRIKTQISK